MIDYIKSLYQKQLKQKYEEFLFVHSQNEAVINRQLVIYNKYKQYVSGKVLDWGCRHAVDSCLIRKDFSDNVEIFGCDVTEENEYSIFYSAAKIRYNKLNHPWLLPYGNNMFDTVIASGVIEHVPNDYESIKEIYRIIKSGGYFIITFLPNKYSYTENINGLLKRPHHNRKYTLKCFKDILLHFGFSIIKEGYHQLLPTGASKKSNKFINSIINNIWKFNNVLENIWPIKYICANIYLIGQK